MNCAACQHENPDGSAFCEECGARFERRCPSCGSSCALAAKFCRGCGTALTPRAAEPADHAVARKVITIVFADLIGSTSLHERLDPESVSRVMERYHSAVRGPVEALGGTVVQLLGDGVMCAFGVPQVAEDDAIRAVRAAVAIQHAFREFAREQREVVGSTGLRVAVNTGEVVVSDDYAAGIGDPLNVAARLQQEAHDGDVLIGESTQRLVRDLVTLEPFGVLSLKGRSETVTAYRVVSLERPAGASATPFVGRDDEIRRVMAVYEAAVSARRARLAVILGSPGLGKSRLVDEVARRLGERVMVLRAQCDAAGGATFAPIAKALRAGLRIDEGASGDVLRAAIESVAPGDDAERPRIAAGITALLAGAPASPEETFFVIRRQLAALAADQPVVLIVDDLHWAEPLLLDLIEHLVQWSTDVPLLMLAAARPELREVRSSLTSSGGPVSDVVTLAGLEATAAARLAANVIGAGELPAAIAGRVLAASEGNPLFVGELVRMLVQDGALKREGDRWTTAVELAAVEMPPTIQALLAARIERLRPEERMVLERAAVVGRQFSRAAVTHLLPREITDLDARLEALRRSELVEPDVGWFLGEPALRFHHVLIRDAAYRRILKGTRAELHARLADWLEGRAGEAVEHDETIGWHLEQAHQHLRELGPIDEKGKHLGERASTHLAAAGRRALARDDLPLAASLLGRAVDRLDAEDTARAELALDWCEALLAAGDVVQARGAIDELGRFVAAEGGQQDTSDHTDTRFTDDPTDTRHPTPDTRLRAWHTCFAGQLAVLTDPQALRITANAVAAAANQLAAAGDAPGEAKAHSVHALALARLGEMGACEAALDRALAAARRGRDRRRANAVLAEAPLAALWGPSPVPRASGRCLDVVRVLRITQGAPAVEAVALRCQAVLEALRGRADAARRMVASSRRMVEELGITQGLLETEMFAGLIELIEGNTTAAEQSLRAAYEGLREHGLGIDAARAAALLGRTLLAEGRPAEAETLSHESEALAGDDLQAAITWRRVRAEALARRGEHAAAVDSARAAVDIAAATDALLHHADARLALATALRAAGRGNEAAAEQARAIELWEAKGATVLAERARRGAGLAQPAQPAPAERGELPRPAPRRVRANAATAHVTRLSAAIAAGDLDALPTLIANGEVVHHPSRSVYDQGELLRIWRRTIEARDGAMAFEPLATLGDSFALCRQWISASGAAGEKFDFGAYEIETIVLVDVDEQGRRQHSEVFAADCLGDAVVRLYERYVELLPEGPERARATAAARAVATLLGPFDLERYATAIVPAIDFVDHRSLGFPSGRGADELLRSIGTLLETADDIITRVEDVLSLQSNALLVAWTTSGRDRVSKGPLEYSFLRLFIIGADGLVTRVEQFDTDRGDQALTRFDELTGARAIDLPVSPPGAGGAKAVRRRVQPNAATATVARLDAAFVARDADALPNLLSDEVLDHTTGVTYDLQGSLSSFDVLLRAQDPICQHEPLATLGDSLALCRQTLSASRIGDGELDVGAYERETIFLVEVDAHGRRRRSELFAADRLGDAIFRLYERYAELLPDGPARDRAAATARSIAAGPAHDFDGWAATLAADIEFVDRRAVGFGSVHGVDAVRRSMRAMLELVDNWSQRFDDILALRPDALLVRWTNSGSMRAGGGAYERPLLMLWIFGADGRVTYIEQFDVDSDTKALARFDERTGEGARALPPSPGGQRRTEVARRRVRPNAATASAARGEAAIARRDVAAFSTIFADDSVTIDHPTGTEYGVEGSLATFRSLLRANDPTYRVEPLATLGDSLALWRQATSANGISGAKFDVGAYERDDIVLVEVDGDGRRRHCEWFATDRLGDAIARLYERYAALLPDGPERSRVAATARSVAALMGPLVLETWEAALAPDVEYVDHRILGLWSTRGAQRFLQGLRSLLEVAADVGVRVDDILGLHPDVFLVRRTNFGTVRASGGAFERPHCWLVVFGTDGLLTRAELFDPDRDTEALARFDELTAEIEATRLPPAQPARRVRPNAATANAARGEAAIARRDVDAFPTIFADNCVTVNHPTGTEYGVEGALTTFRSLLQARDVTYRLQPLASLGDSLAICRQATSSSGVVGGKFDVGAYERDEVVLIEVDEDGRRQRSEWFAADRLAGAMARLYERHADLLPPGPEHDRAAATANAVAVCMVPPDLERYGAALAPTFELIDGRTMGLGTVRGVERNLRGLRALLEISDDFAVRVEDVLALRSDAYLVRWMNSGNDRSSGGAFERQFIVLNIIGPDGLLTRSEWFDADRDTEALARFDELTAEVEAMPAQPVRRVRPNAATANAARLEAAIAARDVDAIAAHVADHGEVMDHASNAIYDRQAMLATWLSLARARDGTYRLAPLATLGDSLALYRQWASASALASEKFDVGAYEMERITLIAVDAQGQRGRTEGFAADRLADAIARLYERYADILPDGPERDRAAATARSVTAVLKRLGDPDSYAAALAPTVEFVDHQPVGLPSGRGAEAFLRALRALIELTENTSLRVDDVLGLRCGTLLALQTTFGTDRASGGAYERHFLSLWVFGADGLLTRLEWFAADRAADALARFDELSDSGSLPLERRGQEGFGAGSSRQIPLNPHFLRAKARSVRRVRANAATANAALLDAAITARDADAIPPIFADGVEAVHHPTGTTYDRRGAIALGRALLRAEDGALVHEPLATLGESLALCRRTASGSGAGGRNFDVGAYENEVVVLIEVDEQGRRRRFEVFAENRLGDAVARLYERYAELLPDGPERVRAAATTRSVAMMLRPLQIDSAGTILAPGVECVDHQTLGFGSVRGAEAFLRGVRSLVEVADDRAMRTDDVVGLRSDALIVHQTQTGTVRVSGGAYERQFLALCVFGADGRLTHCEQFDADRADQALARFDELVEPAPSTSPVRGSTHGGEERTAAGLMAVRPAQPARRVRPNAAIENAARFEAAIAARDVDAVAAHLADSGEVIDHKLCSTFERQESLTTWRSLMKAQDGTYRSEPLAALGDSLALCRQWAWASGMVEEEFDVGASEFENVLLVEVDAQGRRRLTETFAGDRLGDAVVRLYERHAELLPQGPARARAAATARALGASVGPLSIERSAAAFALDIEFDDHRTMGLSAVRGKDALLDALRSLLEVAADAANRIDDVLGLNSDGFLARVTNFGVSRIGGGTYERLFLMLSAFGADGLVTRLEQFDIGHEVEAVARFAALTGDGVADRSVSAVGKGESKGAPTVRRRVRANAATASLARFDAAFAARDADALAAHVAHGKDVDHGTGAIYEARAMLPTWLSLLRAPDGTYRTEPLATLGDALALSRQWASASGVAGEKFDIGAYEIEHVLLIEVDAQGQHYRGDIFAENRLGDAVVGLYERYAELLPEGPARVHAAATARSVAAILAFDARRLEPLFADDIEFVDHRSLGLGSARGAEAALRRNRALLELADNLTFRVDDILGLHSDMVLWRATLSGTDRASGGPFELVHLHLRVFGADGRQTRLEFFDTDSTDEALARFDELARERAIERAVRRVRPNAATASAARFDAAFAAGDADAIAALSAFGEAIDHDTGAIYAQRAMMPTWLSLMKAENGTYRTEPLATLGDALALSRQWASANGVAGGKFDVGAYEIEYIVLIEVDAQGRNRWYEIFARNGLGDAITRLYDRYADLLPSGRARDRAAATARSVAALLGPFDPHRHAEALAAAVEAVDYRTLGTWSARGADALLAHFRSLVEVAGDIVMSYNDVLALHPDAYLVQRHHVGTDRAGGGTYERDSLLIHAFGADGLATRVEWFDADRHAEALARFDELVGSTDAARETGLPPRVAEKPASRVRANAAIANTARLDAAIAARDADALAPLLADGVQIVDHPTAVTYDREGVLFSLRSMLKARDLVFRHQPLAALGDSLALFRQFLSASGASGAKFDVGAYESERIVLTEVDTDGRRRLAEFFAAERLSDAIARLYERYAERLPDGAERTRAAAIARSTATMMGPFDPDRYGTAHAPAIEVVDHRILGTWSGRGAEAQLQNLRALADLCGEITSRVDAILDLGSDALLVRRTNSGTMRTGGGTFERPFLLLLVFGTDGLLKRMEYFDPEREDAALARFDELVLNTWPDPLRSPPNAATRVTEVGPGVASSSSSPRAVSRRKKKRRRDGN